MKSKIPVSYTCTLCKGGFKFEDMRYNTDGKSLVCMPCYNLATRLKKKKAEESSPAETRLQSNKFRCMDCGYRFSLKNTSKIRLICPYCSRDNLEPDVFTAEKILHESAERIYDY